jgi:hypothetical protein
MRQEGETTVVHDAESCVAGATTPRSAWSLSLALVLLTPAFVRADVNPALYNDLSARSFPSRYERVSLFNPWGEDLVVHATLPENFGDWVVAAAQVYADQGIRFDGYMGSDDDGKHYGTASDGLDNAFYGDAQNVGYREVANGEIDDLTERTWICLDLPVHALTLAGYPLRAAMTRDYHDATYTYTLGGAFSENRPVTQFFFRRVRNLRTFLERHQRYVELRITKQEYRDPDFRPESSFAPGDLVFFGHYGDPEDTGGIWHPKHSGIVGTVDARGLPDLVYNMRVSKSLVDHYDGDINQTRVIEGKDVYFERFSDRYSLIGFGRIVNAYKPRFEALLPP